MRGETRGGSCSFGIVDDFNPLPSCEGRHGGYPSFGVWQSNFNPLPSCEGRRRLYAPVLSASYFNPLPSCEGRPIPGLAAIYFKEISIRSPHARGDLFRVNFCKIISQFQSAPLMRGETIRQMKPLPCSVTISIRSPHARGDCYCF